MYDEYDHELNLLLNIVCLYAKKYIVHCKYEISCPSVANFKTFMIKHLKVINQVKAKQCLYENVEKFVNVL